MLPQEAIGSAMATSAPTAARPFIRATVAIASAHAAMKPVDQSRSYGWTASICRDQRLVSEGCFDPPLVGCEPGDSFLTAWFGTPRARSNCAQPSVESREMATQAPR